MTQRAKTISAIILGIIIGLAALFGAVLATNAYLDSQYASLHQGCARDHTRHVATVKNNTVEPRHIDAKKCDTLTIKNDDAVDRMMAFGVHDQHVAYDGIEEQEVRSGQSFTVTLVQTGDYIFHDHMQEEVGGSFRVTE